jgi:hypothetical protein
VASETRRARDLQLLDRIDSQPRHRYEGTLWRVVREGRDPLQGSRSNSRWCNGQFDVLYTSLERNGAIAEMHALLSLQPVFPSKVAFQCHKLDVRAERTLKILDLADLAPLGIDVDRYRDRDYERTQAVADAAVFLGFDGLLVPSARWACANAILFTDRIAPDRLSCDEAAAATIDWAEWRQELRATSRTP